MYTQQLVSSAFDGNFYLYVSPVERFLLVFVLGYGLSRAGFRLNVT